MNYKEDTIAAIATPPGHGGIGIIRVSGPKAFSVGIALFRKKREKGLISLLPEALNPRYLHHGYIVDDSGSVIDEVLITFMKSPYSYTAEDVVEIHAHSGRYILKKILSLVLGYDDIRLAEAGEFTKRAFLNGRLSLTEAEAVMDLINSESSVAHKMAVSMASGGLKASLDEVRNMLVNIEAQITACVDFPDDVDDILSGSSIILEFEHMVSTLFELKKNHENGHQLREGLKIAIAGPPNAGKSSILNRLVSKDRAIVTSVPGTTRDVIEEAVALSGFPAVISDTAGIRDTEDEVEKIGILRTREAIDSADLIIFVIDSSDGFNDEAESIYESIKDKNHIFVINKEDLIESRDDMKSQLERFNPVFISALKNMGMDKLKKRIMDFFEGNFVNIASSIIPNQRQYILISKLHDLLSNMKENMEEIFEPELLSFDIREAISICGELTGSSITPDILDEVFSNFCIGK